MAPATVQQTGNSLLRVTFPMVTEHKDPRHRARLPPPPVRLNTCIRVLERLCEFCVITDSAAHLERFEVAERHSHRDPTADPVSRQDMEDIEWRSGPTVRRISMNSPLVVELITKIGGTGGLGAGAAYLLTHPEAVGSWIPKVRSSWYDAQVKAEKARQLHAKLVAAGMEVEELEP